MPVAGNVVHELWLYLDQAGAPKSGMSSPTDITLQLFKSVGGAAFVGASEQVFFSAISGKPGYYDISYVPESGALYKIDLEELNTDSFKRRWSFTQEVLTAGAIYLPAFTNAFCAETDVERWTQLDFDSGSKPTSTQVAGFAQSRASEIRSILAGENWIVSPSAIASLSGTEQDILREANAIGAAADAYLVKFIDVDPGETEKATRLLEEYQRRIERLVAYAEKVSGGTFIRTPMTAGEVTIATESQLEIGLRDAIAMDQEF